MKTKLAAVDIGTNSFHLIVVEVNENGSFSIVDREKEVIRLGEGSTGDIKNINPDAMERAVSTLKKFKGIAESCGAELRALATSAVRESLNKNEFINRVYKETNVEVEVISGIEEARLIYLGLLRAVPVFDKKVLCIDIGGGSTEFLLGDSGNINHSVSLKLGAVRLSQKFFPENIITHDGIAECENWVKGVIYQIQHEVEETGYEVCVGSSGTIMACGLMILAQREGNVKENTILNNFQFTLEELKEIKKIVLNNDTVKKRKQIPGLDTKRADIIPAGVILLSTIMEQLKIEKLTISGYALREGIILDTIEKTKIDARVSDVKNIRSDSIENLSQSCNYDRKHCRHSANLAVRLFDQLREVHGLSDFAREYLEAGSYLHDIGYHIAHSQHHKHSYYIISNSNLLGFNENEIRIIASVARYHRKSHPKSRHPEFISLPEHSRIKITKLAAILRIADSFDRRHLQIVTDIKCEVKNNKLILELEYEGEIPEIELWSFERRKALFEEVFKMKVSVKEND